MFDKFILLRKYIRYYITAYNGKGHGMHSPFVYAFIEKVLNDKTEFADYGLVEEVRRRFLLDQTVVQVEDLGAGSTVNNRPDRKVATIARYAAKPRKFGQLLYRMARYYRPARIIELGTSLGITTQYLARACPEGGIVSLEGAGAVAGIARRGLQEAGIANAEVMTGNFDTLLPDVLAKAGKADFVFIDGNHREEPTVRYFEELVRHAHNDTILIFDDIHWSAGMETAWDHIRKHPSVRCTIDLFFIGIVFFRQEFREKQEFVIRF